VGASHLKVASNKIQAPASTVDQAMASPPAPPESTRWKPGESGNPSGLSKEVAEVRKLINEAGPKAARTLIELMDCPDPRIALVAAKEIADRAYPKPKPVEDSGAQKPNSVIRAPGPLPSAKEWAESVLQNGATSSTSSGNRSPGHKPTS
jgi:hypothetical protein